MPDIPLNLAEIEDRIAVIKGNISELVSKPPPIPARRMRNGRRGGSPTRKRSSSF
jgi:hypothetical protein